MEDRAVKRGLTNPATLLINELSELENEVSSFEATQRELHMGQRGRLALPQAHPQAQVDEGEGEGEGEIEVAMPRRIGRLNLEEYILYE